MLVICIVCFYRGGLGVFGVFSFYGGCLLFVVWFGSVVVSLVLCLCVVLIVDFFVLVKCDLCGVV
jgi:hypothetical protein